MEPSHNFPDREAAQPSEQPVPEPRGPRYDPYPFDRPRESPPADHESMELSDARFEREAQRFARAAPQKAPDFELLDEHTRHFERAKPQQSAYSTDPRYLQEMAEFRPHPQLPFENAPSSGSQAQLPDPPESEAAFLNSQEHQDARAGLRFEIKASRGPLSRANPLRNPLAHPANTLRNPLAQHANTLRNPLAHPANTLRNPLAHPANTLRNPLAHPANRLSVPPAPQTFAPEAVPVPGSVSSSQVEAAGWLGVKMAQMSDSSDPFFRERLPSGPRETVQAPIPLAPQAPASTESEPAPTAGGPRPTRRNPFLRKSKAQEPASTLAPSAAESATEVPDGGLSSVQSTAKTNPPSAEDTRGLIVQLKPSEKGHSQRIIRMKEESPSTRGNDERSLSSSSRTSPRSFRRSHDRSPSAKRSRSRSPRTSDLRPGRFGTEKEAREPVYGRPPPGSHTYPNWYQSQPQRYNVQYSV